MFGFFKNKIKELFGDKKETKEEKIEEEKLKEENEEQIKEKIEQTPEENIKQTSEKENQENNQKDNQKEDLEKREITEEIKQEKKEIKQPEKLEKKERKQREITEEITKEIPNEPKEGIKEEIQNEPKSEQKKSIGFFSKIRNIFSNEKIDEDNFEEFFNDFEMILLENNIAIEAIDFIKENLKKDILNKEIKKGTLKEEIKNSLKNSLSELMIEPFDLFEKINEKNRSNEPFVMLFLGINGSGKTTSIAKLAYLLKEKGYSIVLGAGDTFRAASIEQLEKHGENLGIKVIKQNYGADPAAVAFDTITYARSHNINVVLIDTAGRMHTKTDLIREMEKIVRVSKPDLKIFVGESITGNDVIEQAKTFNESVNIDGIILSKADIDERGGACISVSYIIKKPILFLGMGQEYNGLELFDKNKILSKIFEEE